MVKTTIVASGASPTAVELGLEIGALGLFAFFNRFRPRDIRDRSIVLLALSLAFAAFSFTL